MACASLGDMALLSLVMSTASWEISTACLSAWPAFSVLIVKILCPSSFWPKKHMSLFKGTGADLLNGTEGPAVDILFISELGLFCPHCLAGMMPVDKSCCVRFLARCVQTWFVEFDYG